MLKKLFFIIVLSLLFIPTIIHAQTTEEIKNFDINITVNTDATVTFQEKIDYYFPTAKHEIFRDIPNRYLDKSQNKNFITPITNIIITDKNGLYVPFDQSQSGDNLQIKIGDPDKTVTGNYQYNIVYTISGIINNFTDHDEFYYNATGNDWEVPIGAVSVKVTLPANVTSSSLQKSCFTGQIGSTEQNCAPDSSSHYLF